MVEVRPGGLGVDDITNPTSLTTTLDFDDTWHVALGAQYKLSEPWLLNFGIAYDSAAGQLERLAAVLPVNSAWRFGVGAERHAGKSSYWGIAAEYRPCDASLLTRNHCTASAWVALGAAPNSSALRHRDACPSRRVFQLEVLTGRVGPPWLVLAVKSRRAADTLVDRDSHLLMCAPFRLTGPRSS
jgi:hypothetical protein